jgi:3-phosphoshikimate 1-carboxyvinyltransferase
LRPIDYLLPVASAQVKSALIFAAMMADGITTIEEAVMTRDHTERMLVGFGAGLRRVGNKMEVRPGVCLKGRDIIVPGDISSAAFFIVLASILPGGKLTLQKNGINPTRTGIIDAMKSMNADIVLRNINDGGEPSADLLIEHRQLNGIEIGGNMIPRLIDELPVIAVAATQAQGRTTVRDATELRVKETDRISAIVTELKKMGARIQEQEDGFVVEGPNDLNGAVCESYNDHRIAMALAVAGVTARGETVIRNAECINVSFPGFIPLIKEVCGEDTVHISQ